MGDKREVEDVDLTWARIPGRTVKRRDRTAPGRVRFDWKTTVPQLLIGLGPENPQNLDSAWVREKDKMFTTMLEDEKTRAKVQAMRDANDAKKREKNFKNDLNRIKSGAAEGVRPLISKRKQLTTDIGHLRLMLEVLVKAVNLNDRSLAFDVLWAIESDEIFKRETKLEGPTDTSTAAAPVAGSEAAAEKYTELKKEIDRMKVGELMKLCEVRGLPTKGNKSALTKVLLPRIKDECEGKVAPPGASTDKADKADKKEKKKSSKKDKKEKGGSSSEVTSEAAPATIEAEMVREYLEKVTLVQQWRDEMTDAELVQMQLTDMSHLLPPLSPFTQKFRLDMWQKQVLSYVDDRKSVLVCAPTSSGKTVISSYVASQGRATEMAQSSVPTVFADDEEVDESDEEDNIISDQTGGVESVLFVVPSEPLVWQVAAHFAKCANLDNKVGLVTDIVTYVPCQRVKHFKGAHKAPPRVTVGTPLALESALTKIRGFVTHKEMHDSEDRAQPAGGFQYKWVVFDEVHALQEDSPDGRALQRLIKMLDCNFLALSATVGNAEQLRTWFEKIRGREVDVETVNALPDEVMSSPLGKIDLSFLQAAGYTNATSKEALELSTENNENIMTVLSSVCNSSGSQKMKNDLTTLAKKPLTSVAMWGALETFSKNYPVEMKKVLDYFNPQRHHSVKLQVHEGRFINLQRHVWSQEEGGGDFKLETLHPLSSVTMEFLQQQGFRTTSLAMTSRDSFELWNRMKELYPMDDIKHLDPLVYFPKSEGRITLEATKKYEHKLKEGLHDLVNKFPAETQTLLNHFTIHDPPRDFNVYDIIRRLSQEDAHSGLSMLPALVFHLDVFELIRRFHELLTGLEEAQQKAHPNFYKDMLTKLTQTNNAMVAAIKGCSTDEEKERVMRDFVSTGAADLEQPHPDFVLSRGVSGKEFLAICEEVNKEDKFGDNASKHALLRALRRGIGVIIEEVSFQAYRRAVMRLATQGKLAVVFSDRSLAFGVNMPFRTCVFCGDMGDRLDALMQQQMAGRAGRRGLDTQGHLVYAGTRSKDIRNLMLAKVSDIHGKEPRFHTQFLAEIMSCFTNNENKGQTHLLGGPSLFEYNFKIENACPNFNEVSKKFLLEMDFIEECDECDEETLDSFGFTLREFATATATPSGYRPRAPYNAPTLWMLWELRSHRAESVAITALLPFFLDDMYRNNQNSAYWMTVEGQLEFIVMILQIVDRHPVVAGEGSAINDHSFVTNLNIKTRDPLRARLPEINERLRAYHEAIDTMFDGKLPQKEELFLNVPIGDPLDDKLFVALHEDTTLHMDNSVREEVKGRLWHIGVILRTMYNCLYAKKDKFGGLAEENRFHALGNCIRKSFNRVKYASRDLIQTTIDTPNVADADMEGGVGDAIGEFERSMGLLKDIKSKSSKD